MQRHMTWCTAPAGYHRVRCAHRDTLTRVHVGLSCKRAVFRMFAGMGFTAGSQISMQMRGLYPQRSVTACVYAPVACQNNNRCNNNGVSQDRLARPECPRRRKARLARGGRLSAFEVGCAIIGRVRRRPHITGAPGDECMGHATNLGPWRGHRRRRRSPCRNSRPPQCRRR